MCLFIEPICYEEFHFHRIDLHNERYNRIRAHFFGLHSKLRLELFLSIPSSLTGETVKCTFTYGQDMVKTEYEINAMISIENSPVILIENII